MESPPCVVTLVEVMALHITKASCSSDSTRSNSFFSIPLPRMKKSESCKSLYQYELVHYPENEENEESQLTDINIYKTLAKPKHSLSFFKSLGTCLKPPEIPQESIEITPSNTHPIPSGDQENLFTLNFPNDFAYELESHGYVHIGAIRLVLSFHNKRGLPMATRIALLDSRYKNYQHACFAIVETTLSSGKLILTVFPNFTIPYGGSSSSSSSPFVVQIQIVGAMVDPGLVQASLSYQAAFRFQSHSRCLGLASCGEIPLIQIESGNAPSTIHIPTSIIRQELVAILSEIWVSNYEKFHTKEEAKRNAKYTITGRRVIRVL